MRILKGILVVYLAISYKDELNGNNNPLLSKEVDIN